MALQKKRRQRPGGGKRERYIQPSILMVLYQRPSYGYELIQNIQTFGFVEGQAPPGMIYRHLHQLEEDRLVVSEWETEGAGPATIPADSRRGSIPSRTVIRWLVS